MLSCWQEVPESRPLFNVLESTIGEMLDENLRKKFIDLNNSYSYKDALNSSKENDDDLSNIAVPKNEPSAMRYEYNSSPSIGLVTNQRDANSIDFELESQGMEMLKFKTDK